jgi:hypothetical protein
MCVDVSEELAAFVSKEDECRPIKRRYSSLRLGEVTALRYSTVTFSKIFG